MDIKGKKILITGGAVRIGRALATYFGSHSAEVIIHCNKSGQEAIKLLEELNSLSGNNRHSVIRADLKNTDEIKEKLFPVLAETDILVNNASVFRNLSLETENPEEAKEQFDINFWAPFTLMNEFSRKRRGKNSLIINILDYRIDRLSSGDGSYLISKDALRTLTKLAALQWAPEIRVNAIAPAFVIPPLSLPFSTMEKSLKKVPMKKIVSVNEICSACLFLCENDSITGDVIFLDGGASL